VPYPQLVRPGRVIGEEEVLDRVRFAALAAIEVTGHQFVDASCVGGLQRLPLSGWQ
jgi:hypothetical protein